MVAVHADGCKNTSSSINILMPAHHNRHLSVTHAPASAQLSECLPHVELQGSPPPSTSVGTIWIHVFEAGIKLRAPATPARHYIHSRA